MGRERKKMMIIVSAEDKLAVMHMPSAPSKPSIVHTCIKGVTLGLISTYNYVPIKT